MPKPRIAITMGDPAGIGPEICLDLLNDPEISDLCSPIVFGDSAVLQSCAEKTNKSFDIIEISENQLGESSKNGIFDLGLMNLDELNPGTADANTGRATYGYVTSAIDACLRNKVDAVVTCPANKEALQAGGVSQPGHTEIFAEHTGTKKFCMAFFSDEISCSLVTVHCGYSEVPALRPLKGLLRSESLILLSVDRIYDVISLTRQAHQKLLGREPRLAVCGLNPHGGENGLFGNQEEENIIIPAIEKAKDEGMEILGPLFSPRYCLYRKHPGINRCLCVHVSRSGSHSRKSPCI